MDVKVLIADAKARFNHNAAKALLKEKYDGKLIVADQGGLWKADSATISLLSTFKSPSLVVIDTFDNPIMVNREQLLNILTTVYEQVMVEWYQEWKELESKR